MSIVKDLLLIILFVVFFVKYRYLYKNMLLQRDYFIKVLSHDLRVSTLAQIRGIELLKKDVNNSELVSNIDESCRYTLDMINMLLNTYRFENGESVLNYEYFNLSELITHVCQNIEFLSREKNIKFVNNFEKNLCIEADRAFLLKAFMIIITTSVFYADKNSLIKICLNKRNSRFEISLQYKGNPLTDEECRRMFCNNTRFSTVGHGIKMHLCKKIVEFHSGKIRVVSKSSRVNSFEIVLPLSNPQNAVKTTLAAPARSYNI